MSAVAQSAKSSWRIILTSVRAYEFGIAALAAIALALAFPKVQQPWLAPVGAAGLFWAWQRLSWKRAFWVGWFAGTIFFALSFSWFSYTVGSFVGRLAFLVVLVPALGEGLAFALAGAGTVLAYRFAPRALAPLAVAAIFTLTEWLRSIGTFGVPFAQLGYTQAATPLAVFAAYAGTAGVTFVICTIGAYFAYAVAYRRNRELLIVLGAIALAWSGCWLAWPARHAAAPTMRVAAIQGNIPQSIKEVRGSLALAIHRYVDLTRQTAAFSPSFVLWPETVITTQLNYDRKDIAKFGALSKRLRTTLVVGSFDYRNGKTYNALYVFGPSGTLGAIYDKRQLVPFAESFPGKRFLGFLPGAGLINDLGSGHVDGVYPTAGLAFAPLICWESTFADLAHAQLRNGAQFFAVATDDAWFGETAGPYQHAQIAQLRAIEGGTWIVRAASTGKSGIIAPDGRYVEATHLDRTAIVLGKIGKPPGSLYAGVGPLPIAILLTIAYALLVLPGVFGKRRDEGHA